MCCGLRRAEFTDSNLPLSKLRKFTQALSSVSPNLYDGELSVCLLSQWVLIQLAVTSDDRDGRATIVGRGIRLESFPTT